MAVFAAPVFVLVIVVGVFLFVPGIVRRASFYAPAIVVIPNPHLRLRHGPAVLPPPSPIVPVGLPPPHVHSAPVLDLEHQYPAGVLRSDFEACDHVVPVDPDCVDVAPRALSNTPAASATAASAASYAYEVPSPEY